MNKLDEQIELISYLYQEELDDIKSDYEARIEQETDQSVKAQLEDAMIKELEIASIAFKRDLDKLKFSFKNAGQNSGNAVDQQSLEKLEELISKL